MISVKEFQRRERKAKQSVMQQIEELKYFTLWFVIFSSGFLWALG